MGRSSHSAIWWIGWRKRHWPDHCTCDSQHAVRRGKGKDTCNCLGHAVARYSEELHWRCFIFAHHPRRARWSFWGGGRRGASCCKWSTDKGYVHSVLQYVATTVANFNPDSVPTAKYS